MAKNLAVQTRDRVGGGGRLNRSKIITVRLDPRLHFAAEIASRSDRRTVSSIVEVAVQAYLADQRVALGPDPGHRVNLLDAVDRMWSDNDVDRFINFAENAKWLLNHEEQRRWRVIKDQFPGTEPLTPKQRKSLHANPKLVQVAKGELPERELDNLLKG